MAVQAETFVINTSDPVATKANMEVALTTLGATAADAVFMVSKDSMGVIGKSN